MSEPAPTLARSDPGRPTEGPPWTVLSLILWSAGYLGEKGVEHGRLDAEHLLAHALGTTRLQLYLQFDRPVDAKELAAFKPLLLRRAKREPLQYVIGRAAFRELDLAVDRRVLIPRPETEVLVDVVLEWAKAQGREDYSALDLGTGSGCIALSLLTEGAFAKVVATDASPDALVVASGNAERAGLSDRLDARHGSLWEPLAADERFDVIVSNPPYVGVEESAALEPEVRDWEPPLALFAGPGGLAVVSAIVDGAAARLRPGGLLALELGLGQARPVVEMLGVAGGFGEPRVRRDLTGRPRIVCAERG